MPGFDPDRYHRRSLRLPGHDYRRSGAYFVTQCTEQRQCLFGDVVDGVMQRNAAGEMVATIWNALSSY